MSVRGLGLRMALAVTLAMIFPASVLATMPGTDGPIVFSYAPPNQQPVLMSVNPDGSDLQQLTYHDGTDAGAAGSPDGSRIAFVRYLPGGGPRGEEHPEIFVMNVDGTDQHSITPYDAGTLAPSWSPDGSQIAHRRGLGSDTVWIMNADGTDAHAVAPNAFNPSWSPHGNLIAYDGAAGAAGRISVIRPDGTGARQLTTDSGGSFQPDFSPDGLRILFHAQNGVYSITPAGTDRRPVLAPPIGGRISDARFSPSGTKLVYLKFTPALGTFGLFTADADGTHEQRLASSLPGGIYQPTWVASEGSGPIPDTTPPSVIGKVRERSSSEWYHTPVTIDWVATDNSGEATQPSSSHVITEGRTQTIESAPACDPSGNCASGSLTVSIDLTDPLILCPVDATFDHGAGGDLVADVVDALSGPASPTSSAPVETNIAGTRSVTVSAQDVAGRTATISCEYEVRPATSVSSDAPAGSTVQTNSFVSPADPIGTAVTTPSAGEVAISEAPTSASAPSGYDLLGQQVQITAPPATVLDPLAISFVLDASLIPATGGDTVSVFRDGATAADCSGAAGVASPDPCVASRTMQADGSLRVQVLTSHASTWTLGVRRPFAFTGFFSPVDNLPTLNLAKAGSAIPVKFALGANQGLNVLAAGFPRSQTITCSSTAPTDGIEETTAASASGLGYEAGTGRYNYVWKSSGSWAGSCRQLVVKLVDGTSHRANFKFR